MSRKQAQARETVARFIRSQVGLTVTQGEVVSVDEAAFTCVVKLPTGIELYDVQLKALREAEKGVVLIPATGATVQLLSLGEPDWLVIAAEEITKLVIIAGEQMEVKLPQVVMDIDGTKVEIKKGLFQVNDGNNGGVPVSKNLVERLNALEKDSNDLKMTLASWVPIQEAQLKSDLIAPGIGWATKFLRETQESDIANNKFKH